MMARPHYIEQILKSNDLVEYLESQGHHPASSNGDRLRYFCPIHGPEKDPSFYVFTHEEIPYYHCFSCRAHGDVINAVEALENKSRKQVIAELGEGLSFDEEDMLSSVCEDTYKGSEKTKKETWEIEEISYKLSRSCYEYLKLVDFDPHEVERIDRVFQKIDETIYAMDLRSLEKCYEVLSDIALPQQFRYWQKKKEFAEAMKYTKTPDGEL